MSCKSYSIILKHTFQCFDYLIAKVIGFLAMYRDVVLCAKYHNRETILFGVLCCGTFIFVFFRLLLYHVRALINSWIIGSLSCKIPFYRINLGKEMTNLC